MKDAEQKVEQEMRRSKIAECKIEQLKQIYNDQYWNIPREDIIFTGPEIGSGGLATVSKADYGGVQIAVKKFHNQNICHLSEEQFRRELQLIASIRHPNLVQFIGATIHGDKMIFLELMPTSLKQQLEKENYFQPNIVKCISLGIIKALNYLHRMQPDAIIHRDISSANVLLEPMLPPQHWRAKVTDYGFFNSVYQLHIETAYSAPEAIVSNEQSPKIDIYSFGILMLQMLTGQLLPLEKRPILFRQIYHKQLLHLVKKCLRLSSLERPSADDIIIELH